MATAVVASRQRVYRLVAWCLFLLLVWGLWLWRLVASDLTFDEAATYFVANRTPLHIIAYLQQAVREHPPLYYLLMNTWMAATGSSEFSLRVFSVIAGLMTLVLTGWVARLSLCGRSRSYGLLPAAALALMPGVAYYAREARMYSLVLLWIVISMGLFLRDWLGQAAWPSWLSIASLLVVNLLGAATHYYTLLFILVQPVVLLALRRWRPLTAWLGSHGIIPLAGLAWFVSAPGLELTTAGAFSGYSISLPTPDQIRFLAGKLLFSPIVGFDVTLLYVVMGASVVGLVFCLWQYRATGVYLLGILLLPLLLAYLLPQAPAPRYVVGVLPSLAITLGTACEHIVDRVKRKGVGSAISASVTACVLLALTSGGLYDALTLERSHYGRTIHLVQANARPGDLVLFYGPWQAIQFRYYAPADFPPIVALPAKAPPRLDPSEAEPVLRGLLATHDRVWVLPASVSDVDPGHYVAGWLSAHTHRVWKTKEFQLYLAQLGVGAPVQTENLVFGQCLGLQRVAYEGDDVPAGEGFRLVLYWRPQCRVDDFNLALTLVDAQGHTWDETSSTPGQWRMLPSEWSSGEDVADDEGLLVPQGAPPGQYTVRIAVTDAATGKPLSAAGLKNVDLLTFEVVEPAHAPVLFGSSDPVKFCPPGGGECLTLVGCDAGGEVFEQGYPVPFSLHWLVPYSLQGDLSFHLRVNPRNWLPYKNTGLIAERTLPLPEFGPGTYSTELAGETNESSSPVPANAAPVESTASGLSERVLTLPGALSLPMDSQTGHARITMEVLGPDNEAWRTEDGRTIIPLFDIRVDGRPVRHRLPPNVTRISADFGEEINLSGYRIDGAALSGGTLRLTYAWHAKRTPRAIYAVFNHLVNTEGMQVAQVDGWPQQGRMLTIQWQAGEPESGCQFDWTANAWRRIM